MSNKKNKKEETISKRNKALEKNFNAEISKEIYATPLGEKSRLKSKKKK